LSTRA